MAKIMLVEDDNNLREIYEARLLAEGYEIVSAKDGEEALALAVKEKPDLIISDVMMPKISGFDMLDILRSTAETRNTKVIMMTALSQVEDKNRADKLGADRYLVKSQVTLEDVAKVAHEVLTGEQEAAQPAAVTPAPQATPTPPAAVSSDASAVAPPSEPTVASPAPAAPAAPAPQPITVTTPAEEPQAASSAVEPAVTSSMPGTQASADPVSTVPAAAPSVATAPSASSINENLTQTTAEEEAAAETQINEILAQPVTTEETVATSEPQVIPVTSPESDPSETPSTEAESNPLANLEVTPAPAEESDQVVTAPVTPADATVVSPEVVSPEPKTTSEATAEATPVDNTDSAVTGSKKVIQPLSDPAKKPDINELLKQEEGAAASAPTPVANAVVTPGAQAPTATASDAPVAPPQSGSVISPNDIAL